MRHSTDIVVVGAGAAGLVTALNAPRRRVTVITPDCGEGTSAASDLAQGGISAAVGSADSTSLHFRDTLRAAQGEFDLAAVRHLCQGAPDAIAYLHSLGVPFARDRKGWILRTEAAHSRARVLHVGDATGAAVMRELRRAIAAAPHVELLPGLRATGLMRDSSGVCGVTACSPDGRTTTIRAHATVIASGGIGGLFSRSTNPTGARGEGIAMALAAGARCEGLEFVQFHPTALAIDARPLPLLTEALRGAGAKLIDEHGVRVMCDVHPLAELAPRDVVARTVYLIRESGRQVFLDASRIDADLAQEFPSAYRTCREHGFDLAREPVPVTSAQHYYMGGIAVDLDGRTSVPGLWAVGEAACTRAHGANRLASNSLLEAVVFGRRTGGALVRDRYRAAPVCPAAAAVQESSPDDPGRELREVMWKCMGVVRSSARIAEGLGFIAYLREAIAPARQSERAILHLAECMLLSAARRTMSCGAHFRSDAALMPLRDAG